MFQPGKSGNPGGRPKKRPQSDRYAAIVECVLPEKIRRPLNLPKGATYGDAIAVGQAMQGIKHARSAKEIREGIEGKATTRLEIVGEGGGPVRLTLESTLDAIRSAYGLVDRDENPKPAAAPPVPKKVDRRSKPAKNRR